MDSSAENPLVGFARRLREIRLERGLSQEQLASLAGLDRTYVSSCRPGCVGLRPVPAHSLRATSITQRAPR